MKRSVLEYETHVPIQELEKALAEARELGVYTRRHTARGSGGGYRETAQVFESVKMLLRCRIANARASAQIRSHPIAPPPPRRRGGGEVGTADDVMVTVAAADSPPALSLTLYWKLSIPEEVLFGR